MMTNSLPGQPPARLALSVALSSFITIWALPGIAEPLDQPLTIEEGAKAFVCEKVGFLSIISERNDGLSTPEFPGVEVSYARGMFVLFEPEVEFNGVDVSYTSFLRHKAGEEWEFTGIEGTAPFVDACRDITSDLAFAFPKIALAASWGMPQVEERVALFDALIDDARSRAFLATADLEEAQAELLTLREENAGLVETVAQLHLERCDSVAAVLAVMTETTDMDSIPDAAVLEEVVSLEDCVEGTVLVSASDADPVD